MKATIEVSDRKEAESIRAGLALPEVRAFVVIMGVLMELPTARARERVLAYVTDHEFEETESERMFRIAHKNDSPGA